MKTALSGPTRSRSLGAVVVGVLALLVPAMLALATPAAAAEEQGDTGWIRAGHLSPGTEKADVRLTPFAGGETRTLSGVDYGDVTPFQRVPAGLYTVAVVPSGAEGSADAMISENVRVEPGTASTVLATGEGGQVRASVLTDDLSAPPAGQARVRLVAATGDDTTVDAAVVDGPTLAEDIASGSATGYATVDAQTWQVQVEASSGDTASSRVPVEAGAVYTLLATDAADGGVELQAIQDSSGSSEMPTGGVDTGAGAPGSDLSAAWSAALLAGVLGLAVPAVRRLRTAPARARGGPIR